MKQQKPEKRKRSVRVEQKDERASQEILQAAHDIRLEGGVEAVTLSSVAGKLNTTTQALYHYFVSKEALVNNLVTPLLDDEQEPLISAVEDSGSDRLAVGRPR